MSVENLDWRVDQAEKRIARLELLEPAVQVQRIDDLASDVRDLRDEMRGVKRALYTAAGSFLVGALLFAATMIASGFGHA